MSRSSRTQFMATKVQAYTPPPKNVVVPTGRAERLWRLVTEVDVLQASAPPIEVLAKTKSEARALFKAKLGWSRTPIGVQIVLA